MKSVLIVDCETTGVNFETDQVVEIGVVQWSVEHRAIIDCASALVPADENPAEHINGIPVALLRNVKEVRGFFVAADAYVAHNALFDRSFLFSKYLEQPLPWICTLEDMKWPKGDGKARSLTHLALAHNCAVVAAHRAINDCLLLARLFESIPDIDERLEAGLAHALLPKAWLVAQVPFDRKDEAKERGFHWDGERKQWRRYMAIADAAEFPFTCRVEQAVAA